MDFEEVPKETTLKYVFYGKLWRKIINASLALYILVPLIDPLLSSKKTYSPLAALTSVSSSLPFIDALNASLTSS